jgi:hypothetical protein
MFNERTCFANDAVGSSFPLSLAPNGNETKNTNPHANKLPAMRMSNLALHFATTENKRYGFLRTLRVVPVFACPT